ncbi:MAG: 16S rRNA methyltransferase [Candidatus Asgardarchaeum californiense]|nr:MAG: 16S rRNA methyltransferase [Candidatus Asgardarchaeum californiense]
MSDHYFTEHPKSQFKMFKIPVSVRGVHLQIYSATGIFSNKKLDFGTKVLIENMIIKKNSKVLDLGCGYGIIGIVYAILSPSSHIFLVDINERAVFITKKNVEMLRLKNCTVLQSNLFEKLQNEFFNIILTNPPITAGLALCFKLIEESYKHLNPDGIFQFVARHKKGGRRLMEKTIEIFGNCEVITKKGGFWVYVAKK